MRMFFSLLALAMIGLGSQPETPAAERPNMIIILADDFGVGDASCFQREGLRPLIHTPHLDKMAQEGTRFTQAYVTAPICSPSRCGLITGQYPGRWRITSYLQTRAGNKACEQDDFLSPAAPALPRVLKAAGYATAHIGKWHLGGGRDVTNAPPFAAYGYDLGYGTYESPAPHPDLTGTNWIWSVHDKVKRWDRTRWMVDQTLEFFRKHKDRPRFVNLWLDDTHTPFMPSAEQLKAAGVTAEKPNDRQRYAAVLLEMDRQIGRLLSGLREMGVERDTLVLFLGDNGALPTFEKRRVAGLRGSKLSLYEGGIRSPLIAWWPGRVPAGRVDEQSVLSTLDFLPTLGALAQAKMPADSPSDGQDVSEAFFGKNVARREPLFWEYGRNTNSFAFPQMAGDRSPNLAVREGRWKLLVNANGAGAELYDLEADRNETQLLTARHPELTERLRQAVLAWRKTLP